MLCVLSSFVNVKTKYDIVCAMCMHVRLKSHCVYCVIIVTKYRRIGQKA